MSRKTAEQRFWARVDKGDGHGCWIWKGRLVLGYGRISVDGKVTTAHRYSYRLHVGPISADLHVDHLCRNRACVRPDHLEAVTPAENVLRGEGYTARNARKETCPEGHEYDRVDRWNGARVCSICVNRKARERYTANSSPRRDDQLPDLVSVAEAAAIIGVSPKTIQVYVTSGQLAGQKIGVTWVFRRALVEELRDNRSPRTPR